MADSRYRLLPEEAVVYEGPGVVLTSHRLMANFGRSDDGSFDEAPLSDLAAPKKSNGGKPSHAYSGARFFVVGAIVLVGELLAEAAGGLNDKIASLLFLVGGLGVAVGMYFIIGGLLGVKPNTTVVFRRADGGQIIVPFRDWDSPDADELTRQFARIKRGL